MNPSRGLFLLASQELLTEYLVCSRHDPKFMPSISFFSPSCEVGLASPFADAGKRLEVVQSASDPVQQSEPGLQVCLLLFFPAFPQNRVVRADFNK